MKTGGEGRLTAARGRLSRNKLRYRKKARDMAFRVAVYFILINLAFVFLFPFLQLLIRSIKSPQDLMDVTVNWFPRSPRPVENYYRAFAGLKYPMHFLVSAALAILPTIGTVFSAALVGYGFARYRFKGRGVLFMLVLLTLIVPPQSIVIPLYGQFTAFGWLSGETPLLNLLPLILPNFFAVGLKGGLFIFIFRQSFKSMPVELEEAARLDGCGMFRTFFKIALPLAGAAILVTAILSIVWQWNNFYEPQVYINSESMWTLPMMLGDFFNQYYFFSGLNDTHSTYNGAVSSAATMLVLLPMLIFYAVVQRLFIKGIERTGLVE